MNYKLLFIDIETNGLSPIKDDVIEIAGVFVDNGRVIDIFNNLINIEKPLPDIVKKITGLDDNLIAKAKKADVIHESWANFVEKIEEKLEGNQKVYIIGHSLSEFDILFLKNKSFYLPQNYEIIDTFYLSKILLPQFAAVNLEALIGYLSLDSEIPKLLSEFNEYNNILDTSETLIPHRALFDTLCAVALFNKLVEMISLYKLPVQIQCLLVKHFLKIEILPNYNITTNEKIQNNNNINIESIETKIQVEVEWTLEPKQIALSQIVNTLQNPKQIEQYQETILKFINSNSTQINRVEAMYILQLYVILLVKKEFNYGVTTHGRRIDQHVLEYLFDFIQGGESDTITKTNKNKQILLLPRLENLIWKVDEIASQQINFETFVELIGLINNDDNSNKYENGLNQLLIAQNSYDYLKLALESYLINGQYTYNPKTMTRMEENIYHKLRSFVMEISSLIVYLHKILEVETDLFRIYLIQKLNNWINNTLEILNPDINCTIHQQKEHLRFSYKKADFNLETYILDTIFDKQVDNQNSTDQNEFILPSYLNLEDTKLFLNTLNLTQIAKHPKLPILHKQLQTSESGDSEILLERVFYSIESLLNKITLDQQSKDLYILVGPNNKVMTKVNEFLHTTNIDRNNWMVVGNSYSLTKVLSKINSGFSGIVCLKQNEVWMIKNIQSNYKSNIRKIFLLGNYHMFISKYFGMLDKYKIDVLTELLNKVQKFYIQKVLFPK